MQSLLPTAAPAAPTPAPMPTAQAAPGQTAPNDLQQSWTSYFQTPQVRAMLMQFGTTMLQPRQAGQGMASQVGQAIGEAGQAGARVSESQRLDRKDQREQSRLDLASTQAAQGLAVDQAQLDLARSAEARAGKRDAAALEQQGVENKLKGEELALQKKKAAALEGYYAAIAGNKGSAKNPPGYDDALDVAKSAAALEEDPMASFFEMKARIDAQYGLGGTVSTAAPQGAPVGAPQPGTVIDGFKFKGGNPADKNAWEKVK